MWPYCVQPLYAFGLPVIVNVSEVPRGYFRFWDLGGSSPPQISGGQFHVISYAQLFPSEGIEMKSGLTAPLSDYPFLYPQNLAIFRFGGNSVFFFGGGMFPPQTTPEFLRPHHPSNRQTHLRIISTQENYRWNAWIGTDKKIFLCVKVISSNPQLTWQRKIFLSVPIHGWFSWVEINLYSISHLLLLRFSNNKIVYREYFFNFRWLYWMEWESPVPS